MFDGTGEGYNKKAVKINWLACCFLVLSVILGLKFKYQAALAIQIQLWPEEIKRAHRILIKSWYFSNYWSPKGAAATPIEILIPKKIRHTRKRVSFIGLTAPGICKIFYNTEVFIQLHVLSPNFISLFHWYWNILTSHWLVGGEA